ncbi:MAG: hypothetical protein HY288_20595, partial [Planctomycetia bacterium]|nr:hypothetical protein [Planctomycetia bacterium]
GERFCVRNSGASAVVEGIGDHGCEYMTGGRAVVLGKTGRNFAAGMSGGIAYVLDLDGTFPDLVNKEMVDLEDLGNPADQDTVLTLIRQHVQYTNSARGRWLLDNWHEMVGKFVKIMPKDYKLALKKLHDEAQAMQQNGTLEVAHG